MSCAHRGLRSVPALALFWLWMLAGGESQAASEKAMAAEKAVSQGALRIVQPRHDNLHDVAMALEP